MKKVAYAGFDLLYPCLEALEEAGCTVMRVFTFPTDNDYEFNRRVVDFARARHIPWTDRPVTRADLEDLAAAGCEALFSAGYIYRIPWDTPLRCVNVHPSLLPVGRGPWPMPCTILKGLTESGVTLHKVIRALDAGEILLQEAFPVTGEDDLETLTRAIHTLAPRLVRECVAHFDRLWAEATPQSGGEYWPEPGDGDRTLTPDDSARRADRVVRAFAGYGCLFRTEEETFTVVRGEVRFDRHAGAPGTRRVEGGVVMYALHGGWLRIFESKRVQ